MHLPKLSSARVTPSFTEMNRRHFLRGVGACIRVEAQGLPIMLLRLREVACRLRFHPQLHPFISGV